MLGLAAWLLVCYAAAAVGGLGSSDSPAIFGQHDRPSWAPPAWVFGPVWAVLYTMQGVAAWLVWREREREREPRDASSLALGVFLAQLAVNALWTWLFFAWRRGALSFGEILLLAALIAASAALFWRVRPLAGALLVPYLIWVAYASALTYSLWRRNPDLLG